MNRFSEKQGWLPSLRERLIQVLVTLAVFAVLLFGIFQTGQDAAKREKENLERSLEQSVVLCYALEGAYPASLDYLKEHYGIQWNEKQYLVTFEAVGRNLPPDIAVIDLQKGGV